MPEYASVRVYIPPETGEGLYHECLRYSEEVLGRRDSTSRVVYLEVIQLSLATVHSHSLTTMAIMEEIEIVVYVQDVRYVPYLCK